MKLRLSVGLLVLLTVLVSLEGCATIFPVHSEETLVSLPDSVEIFDMSGVRLPIIKTDYGERTVPLTSPRNDSVFVRYGNTLYEVRPRKSIRLLAVLDLGIFGATSFIDDLLDNSFHYSEVSFADIDTTGQHWLRGGALDTVSARSSKSDHPYLLCTADYSGIYNFENAPLAISPRGEVGLGFGIARRIEVFAEYETLADLSITNDHSWQGTTLTKSIKTRLYPYRGFYLSGGVGWVHAIMRHGLQTPNDAVGSASDFHEVLFGIGYAASWTFVEFEQSISIPRHIYFGTLPMNYASWELKFGVNLRFP